jgi:predicted nuclease with TOPRIM domain
VEQLSVVVTHNLKKCVRIMPDQEIKDLIRARGRVQASLTRIQTFVQQYDGSQDILNIKLRMGRLEEKWSKYEEIQDRLESIHCDSSKRDDFRNDFKTKFYDLNVKMQRIIDEYDAKSSEQVHPTDSSEQGSSNLHNSLKLPAIKFPIFSGQ